MRNNMGHVEYIDVTRNVRESVHGCSRVKTPVISARVTHAGSTG
ncbi:MAG: hypothetical protein WBX38_03895 [Candidatus Sulfotelmatobacter sp.]